MFTLIFTLILGGNSSMSTTTVGNYKSEERCHEAQAIIMKSYAGSNIRTISRCVPSE